MIEASAATTAKVREMLPRAAVRKSDFDHTLKEAKDRAVNAGEAEGAALGDHLGVVDGRFCNTLGGCSAPLCNFDARIVEERILDDGVEKQRCLVIAGTLEGGEALPRITLKPDDLADPLWPLKHWGTVAKIASRKGVIDDLRLALQKFSNPRVHTAFLHTGWWTLTDATGVESGLPVFLNANGAIGASGVSVELADRLSLYSLPAEPQNVPEAVRASLALCDLAPKSVMYPLIALPYRAPFQSVFPADLTVFLTAPTGHLKTSISKVVTAHFGAGLAKVPVTSWAASVSSIEMTLHRLRDVLVLLDDFKPKSTKPNDEARTKAHHIISSLGNLEGRGRMRSDGNTRPSRPPGSLVLTTGELLPAGASTVARILPLNLQGDTVDLKKLSAAQANVAILSHAMAGYILWLRPRLYHLKDELPAKFDEFRARFRSASGEGAHLRTPEGLGHIALGLEYFWKFAIDVGALTERQGRAQREEALEEFSKLAKEGTQHACETDPVRRFLDVLRELLDQRTLATESDLSKDLAQRREQYAVIAEYVGWDDEHLFYFLGTATYSAVHAAMEHARIEMPLDELTLWRQLRDRKLIEESDRSDRLRKRVKLGGERIEVIVMKKSVLYPDDGPAGPSGESGTDVPETQTLIPDFDISTSAAESGTANRTTEGPNRTNLEPNRTTGGVDGQTGEVGQSAEITTTSSAPGAPPGPVGPVGPVEREEKSRESTSSEDGEHATHDVVGVLPSPPGTGPTGPTGPAAASPGKLAGSSILASSRALAEPDQPDHSPRALVADGLGYLRRGQAAADGVWCIRTVKRLLEEGPFNPSDWGRKAELEARLRDTGLAGVAELEFYLLPVIAALEKAGVGLDVDAWAELVDQAERELAAQRVTLAALGLSQPEDNARVREAVVGRGVSVTSTSWKALTLYMQDPLVAALVPYRRAAGFLDSTGRAVLEAARRGNGRVRGRFDPLAAPTGRMSCSKPNLLGIPKDPAYRRCIVPAAGCLLVVADYAAIELRVLAEVTGDPTLTKVFVEGGDPHAATAAALLGKMVTEVTKDERQRAKAVNFGFAFGMGPTKFVEHAQGSYSLSYSRDEAANARDGFLGAYPGVARWQLKIKKDMPMEVRTLGGRRRIFNSKTDGYCERLNTPVQGTAADGLKLAMVLLHRRLPEYGARLVLAVHDELLVEAPEDRARDVQDVVEKTMVEGMARFVRSVPIKVEASVRQNWADPL